MSYEDERIQALRESVELLSHDVRELRDELGRTANHHKEQIDGLVIASHNLLKVAESHERRLRRLEGRS